MKKVNYSLYFLFFMTLFLGLVVFSCNETLEVDSPKFVQKLTVESYINNQSDSIFLKLSKTMSPYEYILHGDTTLQAHNARIKINLDGREYLMTEDTAKTQIYGGYTYDIYRRTGEYYLKGIKLSDVNKCSLEITYNDMQVSSCEEFPKLVKLHKAVGEIKRKPSDYASFYYNTLLLDLYADFPKGEKCYYRINVIANYSTSISDGYQSNMTQYNILNSNGEKEFIEIYLGNINQDWVLKNIKLTLDHISEKYYNFINALDVQHENDENIMGSEGTLIPSNIKGGYGIFTCISRDTICVDIK